MIDRFIDFEGRISSFLIYPLVFVVIFEVFMRYVVNKPTIWGFEATSFVYGLHFMLGLAYTERHGGHVRVDILMARLSPKTQAIMGVITYSLIFMPVFLCMGVAAIKFAHTSSVNLELNSTSWAPPIYPFKILMALSFVFLLLQGFSTLLKHIQTLTRKPDEVSHES